MTGRAALLAVGCLCGSLACLSPIDLSAKQCPCAPGYVCSRNRCVSEQCTAAVRADDFRAEWTTSNTIRWAWTPSGDRSKFVRYELRMADDEAGLSSQAALVVNGDQNPELDFYVLPRTNGTEDLVTHTMVPALVAQHSYVGQLVVIDSDLCAFRTPAAAASTTLDVPDEVVLFRDADPPGAYHQPSSLRTVDDAVGPGRHLEWVPDLDSVCDAGSSRVCGDNLRVSGMAVSVSRLRAGSFATAFLELKVANGGTSASTFSRTWLGFHGCGALYGLEPFVIPPGDEYRTVQVPLRALLRDGRALSYPDLTTDGGATVCEVNLGGSFSRSSPDGGSTAVRLDDVRVRF